jgi:adenylate cyclase
MKRPLLPFLLIALGVSIFLSLLIYGGVLGLWQHRFSDALYGGIEPLKNIVIIAVDDKSLQEIGRWPWSRQNYVALLQHLNGSKLIGFDISFFEPSTQLEDEALGRAMRSAGNVIIPQEAIAFAERDSTLIARGWLKPVPALENITTGVVNIFTDADGASRSIPVRVGDEPSLAFVLAEKFIGSKPSFDEQRMLVNFIGRPFSYKTYSFTDVINQRTPAEEFKDKIVLVGATAPDLHDDYLVPTSWGRHMPGVEIHAHALQTILTRRFVREQSLASTALVIALLSLAAASLFWRFSGTVAGIATGVMFIGVFGAALFFYHRGILLNLIHQPLALLLTSVACIAYIARTEARHKKHILSVFGRYVSKDVVDHLLTSEAALELGGQEREISVLFVDIRGFTAISEKLTPHQVIAFLNHYFGHMTDIVFKNNGTLDKFIGDSIMAVFNSPHDEPDHAFKAVKTAVEMQEACKRLQREGLPKVQIGIGVNTGKAVVGNMGSAQRQEFTALGDTVNTSSRLCGVAEPGQIIIAESAYEQCKDRIIAKRLPPLKVKGKEKPLIVYDVSGLQKK